MDETKYQGALSTLGEGFNGADDLSLSFPNNTNFSNERETNESFSFVITNNGASAVDKTIALFPGYLLVAGDIKDAGGNAVDAIATDGNIITAASANVVGTGKPKKIAEFIEFCKRVPTRCVAIKMLVDDASQLENELVIRSLSPFSDKGYTTITPSHFKNSNQLDDKRVEIPTDFAFDLQTAVIIKVNAGRTVTLNLFTGGKVNVADELKAKREFAAKTSNKA